MIRALYPGTFDPIHNGHVDIATRARRLFDELVIGIYDSPPKTLLFDTSAALRPGRDALAHLPNVRVRPIAASPSGSPARSARRSWCAACAPFPTSSSSSRWR